MMDTTFSLDPATLDAYESIIPKEFFRYALKYLMTHRNQLRDIDASSAEDCAQLICERWLTFNKWQDENNTAYSIKQQMKAWKQSITWLCLGESRKKGKSVKAYQCSEVTDDEFVPSLEPGIEDRLIMRDDINDAFILKKTPKTTKKRV